MKSCLKLEKTASSALIFATLGCLAASFSPAKAAQDISTSTAATLSEASNQKLQASTDFSALIEKTSSAPTASQPTVTQLTNPINYWAIQAVGGGTSAETTPKAGTKLAAATPTNPQTRPEIPHTKQSSEFRVLSPELQERDGLETPGLIRTGKENPSSVNSPNSSVELHSALKSEDSRTLDELKSAPGSKEALETTVENLTKQPHLEAQALPDQVDSNDPLSTEVTPLAPGESEEVDASMDQVTNVTQLSDVRPSDWAYEALRSLVERYGCIAGYPDGTFRGNRAMSRYEFAAGLNSCLQQIERLIAGQGSNLASRRDLEALQRLVAEFQPELARIGARVDRLEGRTAFLEDHQFSTTTKLFGQAIFGVQGRSEYSFDYFLDRFTSRNTSINLVDSVQLSLFTQFSPRSLLLTGLAAGNGNVRPFPSLSSYESLGYESGNNNNVELSDLNFRQLIGNNFALIVGPLGVNPVNVFRGVNRVESAGEGPLSRFAQRNPIIAIGGGNLPGNGAGIGFDWQLGTNLSFQGVYSVNGAQDPLNGGIFGGNEGSTTGGAQLVFSPTSKIDVSLQYINAYSPSGQLGTGVGDDLLVIPGVNASGFQRAPIHTDAFGLNLEWRVSPRFTVGGWAGYTTSNFTGGSGIVETINWMGFLNFPDLLGRGNLAGIYVGQPPKIISSDVSAGGVGRNIPSFINQGDIFAGEGGQPGTTLHVEGFYRFRVTDNISLTPGVIFIFNPNQNDNNDTITIGALRTTFTF